MSKEIIISERDNKLYERLRVELGGYPAEHIRTVTPVLRRSDESYIKIDRATIEKCKDVDLLCIFELDWTSEGYFKFFNASDLLPSFLKSHIDEMNYFCLGVSLDGSLEEIFIFFEDSAILRLAGDDFTAMTPNVAISFFTCAYGCLYDGIALRSNDFSEFECEVSRPGEAFDVGWIDVSGLRKVEDLLRFREQSKGGFSNG